MPKASPSGPKRLRRAPEEARAGILAAAERVFARALPDAVGLKDVAKEAGVSHALVTHYFGTYSALVEACIERKIHALRDSLAGELQALVADGEDDGARMLARYRAAVGRALEDPVTIRLAAWAFLSGRVGEDDVVLHRAQGLRIVADALEARSGLPRDEIEFALVASFALTVTWKLGRGALSGALGRKPSAEADAQHEAKVTRLLDGYLARAAARQR